MTQERLSLGRLGERLAREYLQERGYRVVAENFRTRLGEIDLIARHGKTLVFVEVKTRRSHTHGHPFEAVTPRKQAQLSRVALEYMSREGGVDQLARFDVVGITVRPAETRIELVTNAFALATGR
ncbi:MAG: YraN family protein [Deltaproteobacteria bacterium CG23_combo_of_CG06-09_8_20_14_all_60_8]|nr:MAG: YraN family protein [Desulfobacterales bacterium CG2_30_60_27]PIP44533.1 MAG: YraN family protein [Deltaproteobacteria bacterium CG23_combo_of_CG06-09_8_20_14_all_60_8]